MLTVVTLDGTLNSMDTFTLNMPGRNWNAAAFVDLLEAYKVEGSTIFFDVDLTLLSYQSDEGYEVRPGAVDTMRALHTAGWDVSVWSSGGAAHCQMAVDLLGVGDIVSNVYSKTSYPPRVDDVVKKIGFVPTFIVDDDETEVVSGLVRVSEFVGTWVEEMLLEEENSKG